MNVGYYKVINEYQPPRYRRAECNMIWALRQRFERLFTGSGGYSPQEYLRRLRCR